MTTGNLQLFIFGMFMALFGFGLGTFGTPIINEVPITEYIYLNNTVERIEVIKEPCDCLDARNEGYLDGVAECGMNKMYVEAKDGRYQSIDDNINGFNVQGVAICVQTVGRSEGEILAAFMEELFHQHLFSEANRESICLEHEEAR